MEIFILSVRINIEQRQAKILISFRNEIYIPFNSLKFDGYEFIELLTDNKTTVCRIRHKGRNVQSAFFTDYGMEIVYK
jgi:hypothetical protein